MRTCGCSSMRRLRFRCSLCCCGAGFCSACCSPCCCGAGFRSACRSPCCCCTGFCSACCSLCCCCTGFRGTAFHRGSFRRCRSTGLCRRFRRNCGFGCCRNKICSRCCFRRFFRITIQKDIQKSHILALGDVESFQTSSGRDALFFWNSQNHTAVQRAFLCTNLHTARRYVSIFFRIVSCRNRIDPQAVSCQICDTVHRHRQRQVVETILSVCIGIGNLFCFRQQFPLSVAAIILPEYDLHIGDTGFAVADLMISVCIVPDNTGDRYMRILLHNAAVISGDICRLYNVIVHAANLTAIRCISAECFRQD